MIPLMAIGALTSLASSTMSFLQASEQDGYIKKAEAAAQQYMDAARKKLEVNYYDSLSIQKEPYALERDALLSQGAQTIQASADSDRGAAVSAGLIQMAQQQGQAQIRKSMGEDLNNLAKLSAEEDAVLQREGFKLDLEEAAGAKLAAANSRVLKSKSILDGFDNANNLYKFLDYGALDGLGGGGKK